jgi:hypothetical protein
MSGLLYLLRRLQQSVTESERVSFLSDVYSDECVASCVFQQLGDLEKSFILRMLLLDRPLKEQLFKFWTIPPPLGMNPQHAYAPPLQALTSLGIFTSYSSSAEEPSYNLNSSFRTSLIAAMSHAQQGPKSSVFNFFSGSTDQVGDETKWHSLLERTISTTPPETAAVSDIERVILRLGFGTTPRPPAAYKFVLSDVTVQLWTLLSEYASMIERERVGLQGLPDMIKTIAGVMTGVSLSPKTLLGLSSEVSQVTKRTITFLKEMDAVRSPTEVNPFQKPFAWLGPTAAALHPTASNIEEDLLLGSRLIVDSNMHVTAYTRSNLQRQLISMFCDIHRQIGNVVIGVLTRRSVQAAIDSGGVSSESIVRFLSTNLHPFCGGKLPTNVALQIKLWDADCPRNRLKIDPCVTLSWRGDRTEQASSAIAQVKLVAEAQKALLFFRQETDGSVHMGLKADVARTLVSNR